MKPFRKLSTALSVYSLILVFVPLFIITIVTVIVTVEHLKSESRNDVTVLAEILSFNLEKNLESNSSSMKLLTDLLNTAENSRAQTVALNALNKQFKNFTGFIVLDKTGKITAATDNLNFMNGFDMSGEDYYKKTITSGRLYFSPVSKSFRFSRNTLSLAGPLRKGIVVGFLNLQYIQEMLNRISSGQKGKIEIMDSMGNILAHSDPGKAIRHENEKNYKFMAEYLRSGSNHYFTDVGGEEVLVGISNVEKAQWLVAVMISEKYYYFDPLKKIILTVISGFAAALVVTFLISYTNIKKLTSEIFDLIGKAVHIKNGRYSRISISDQYEEFQMIAHSYNSAMNNIEQKIKELENARIVAEASSTGKSQFLANMSHEIRIPLNGIIGMANLALMNSESSEQKDYLTQVVRSADSLLKIVNDILDYSKMEAGFSDSENVEFDFHKTVSEITDIFTPLAMSKGLNYSVDIDSRIPNTLCGERIKLKQVLSNLIGNALKFTDDGEITVSVTLISKSDKKAEISFSVRDTGIGIEDSQINLIFKSFTQADTSYTKKYGGTGLGLAISRKNVELMGGKIGVVSHHGIGSTFTFNGLFGVCESKTENPAVDTDEKIFLTSEEKGKCRILVVEDDPVSRKLLEKLLMKENFTVHTAENGLRALELYRDNDFDLIFMDIQMPEMDGLTAASIIREKETEGKSVPIVALSAYSAAEDIEKSRLSGMNEHLSKPVNFREVYKIINKYISVNN